MRLMGAFAARVPANASVLDVGSQDVCGSYRSLFPSQAYVGLDVAPGRGVDVVVEPYDWTELGGRVFDFIISGQALEHIEFPWETMRLMAAHLKPGGRLCVIVPARWPLHYFPLDCYRFHPDGLSALGKWAGLRLYEGQIHEIDALQADCYAEFIKEDEKITLESIERESREGAAGGGFPLPGALEEGRE